MFFFNFIFWLMGLLLMGIGIYAIMDKWSSGEQLFNKGGLWSVECIINNL